MGTIKLVRKYVNKKKFTTTYIFLSLSSDCQLNACKPVS